MAMNNQSATVLILGATGHGKSLLGDRLLRLDPNNKEGFSFATRDTCDPITWESEKFTASIDGFNLTVIDTPGLFDSETNINDRWHDVLKAVLLAGKAVDVIIFAANIRRLHTAARSLEKILDVIDIDLQQIIVVFTHLANPTENERRGYLKTFNEHLKRGVLGLKHIFSDQLADGQETEKKMTEIRSLVMNIKSSSESYIDKTRFENYTKRVVKNIVETFPKSRTISLADLKNSPSINMEVITEFIEETDIDEILQTRSESCIII